MNDDMNNNSQSRDEASPWKKLKSPYFLIFLAAAAFAVSFGVSNLFSNPDDEVLGAIQTEDGKTVVAGRLAETGVFRRNADGSVDSTLYKTWLVGGFNSAVIGVAREKGNSLIAVGEFTSFDQSLAGHILRLNADGNLDTAFAAQIGTGFDDTVQTVRIQNDGKIVVGGAFMSFNGSRAFRIARLNPDGSLDETFDSGIGFDGPVRSLVIDSQGYIIAGGDFGSYGNANTPYLVRLSADGHLDSGLPLDGR